MTNNIVKFQSKEKTHEGEWDSYVDSFLEDMIAQNEFLDNLEDYMTHIKERFIEHKNCRVFYMGMTRISIEKFDNVKEIQARKKTLIIRA